MCTTTSSCAHQLKQRIFVLIFLVLVTRSQTPFLYVRHDQVCPVALIRVIPHCRGVHMHTDLRRVFSSVGSFDCQGTGKIKESLPQM